MRAVHSSSKARREPASRQMVVGTGGFARMRTPLLLNPETRMKISGTIQYGSVRSV